MKKMSMIFMLLAAMNLLAACGSSGGKASDKAGTDVSVQTAEPEEGGQPEGEDGQLAQTKGEAEEQAADPAGTPADSEIGEGGSKALVVYFSATGNTKAVAEAIARQQGADIYEIVPEQPYTDEDLNYNDKSSRATAEQNDSDARPAISGGIENLDSYDLVYVGYPIWWGDMPRILYTFFDAYDLTGKTVAPFCTSGGSGLSGTPKAIGELEAGAEVLEGLHVRDSAADDANEEVSKWLDSIGQAG